MNIASRGRIAGLDDRATAALLFGVAGLFLFNIVFGPLAIVLGVVAATRPAAALRSRAAGLAGAALGIADLVVLAVLVATQLVGGGPHWLI
jgi:hypothetical protein